MADNQFLQQRGNVWTYYRRVPTHLVPAIGKTFIKKSLGTTDLKEARRRRNVETMRVDALFAQYEAGMNDTSEAASPIKPGTTSIPLANLEEHVRRTVAQLDRKAEDRLAANPPINSEELSTMRMDAEIDLSILKDPDDPRQHEWIALYGDRILKEAGTEIKTREELVRFGSLVRRALIELQVRKLDRYDDQPTEFKDPFFDPKRMQVMNFKTLVSQYLEDRRMQASLNNVNRKTMDKDEAICRTLIEIVGGETPISRIDYDRVREVQMVIARLPSNRTKLYPGKSLETVLKISDSKPEGRLAHLTQRSYLDTFENIMALALKKRLVPSNPALDLRPLKRDDVAPEDKRKPWRPDQLKAFFEGKFYRRFAPDAAEPYSKADVAWRFWMPLIMLFSGSRPNEVAQLTARDFQLTPKGTLFINLLNDNTGDDSEADQRRMQLKTATSRRRIPVHSMLRRFGLEEFVDHVSKGGREPDARLFPTLTPNEYGNFAWYALRRFNEHFFKQEVKLEGRQSAYSFRHNVRDALRAVDAPAATLKAVTGWAPGTKSASDNYGDPGNPDFHAKWVELIQYDLDLDFLTGAGAKLTPPIQKVKLEPPNLK